MKRFLFLVGCFFSTIAAASNWQPAAITDNLDVLFFDKDSIVHPSSDRIQVRAAYVLSKDVPIKNPPYAVNLLMSLQELDTKKRVIRDLQRDLYKDGVLIKSFKNPSPWEPVIPGTSGNEFFEQVVGRRVSFLKSVQGGPDELVPFGRGMILWLKMLVESVKKR